jgi:hypothetical protein
VLQFHLASANKCGKPGSRRRGGVVEEAAVSGFGRITLIGSIVAAVAGIASVRAQTQLSDPRDAPRIFASTCSACHKSPQGLAKSGQVAGFLRQHYTTGPEMSASMAAYLVAAGNGPAAKKGKDEPKTAASDSPAAKGKQKKQEHAVIQPGNERANPDPAKESRDRRAKQMQQAKGQEERAQSHPSPAPAADVANRQAAAPAVTAAIPAVSPPAAPQAPLVVLDIPLPEMPAAPPPDLTQSVFSSSPVP